jgi:hypothetical protein
MNWSSSHDQLGELEGEAIGSVEMLLEHSSQKLEELICSISFITNYHDCQIKSIVYPEEFLLLLLWLPDLPARVANSTFVSP